MDKRLGRGISALIPEKQEEETSKGTTIQVSSIIPNKYQPRKKFDEARLSELKDSIREKGLIQPIIVRSVDGGYELIAGERRFRAVKELGLTEIPAIIKEVNDSDSLKLSLIENIQREELNAIEEANAFKRLMDEFNLTQDEISRMVGKDKSTVSNTLRLLALPSMIQKFVEENVLSMGHAKALLSIPEEQNRIKCAEKIIKGSLSVRQAEELVKAKEKTSPLETATRQKDQNVVSIEETLQHALGTKVKIACGKKRGKIEIEYYSNEDLDRIVGIISRNIKEQSL